MRPSPDWIGMPGANDQRPELTPPRSTVFPTGAEESHVILLWTTVLKPRRIPFDCW